MDYPKVGKLEGKLIALTGVNYWGVVGQLPCYSQGEVFGGPTEAAAFSAASLGRDHNTK
jgi:hypothetical protein